MNNFKEHNIRPKCRHDVGWALNDLIAQDNTNISQFLAHCKSNISDRKFRSEDLPHNLAQLRHKHAGAHMLLPAARGFPLS